MYKSVDGRWGHVTYFAKDEYVGKSLHYYGEYNPDETEKILELAQPGKLCLDIGANIGVISQALEHSGFQVVAYEPQPEVYKVLQMNFKGLAFNLAVGSERGIAKMPKLHYSEKGNFGGISLNTKSAYGSYDVVVTKIDEEFPTADVGFMKIDVEGYELEVLRGATEMIKRCKPVMYIEDDRERNSRALREYICRLGYNIDEHRPTLYRENNFFGLKKNVWDKNYASHNLICMPC